MFRFFKKAFKAEPKGLTLVAGSLVGSVFFLVKGERERLKSLKAVQNSADAGVSQSAEENDLLDNVYSGMGPIGPSSA